MPEEWKGCLITCGFLLVIGIGIEVVVSIIGATIGDTGLKVLGVIVLILLVIFTIVMFKSGKKDE